MLSESNPGLSKVQPFNIGVYRVEPATLRVISGGRVERLEPRAMQVLVYLVRRPGEVISRTELEENIWEGRVVGEDALTNTISKLRKIFRDKARSPEIIETLPKIGYRLIADVEWTDDRSEKSADTSSRTRERIFRAYSGMDGTTFFRGDRYRFIRMDVAGNKRNAGI